MEIFYWTTMLQTQFWILELHFCCGQLQILIHSNHNSQVNLEEHFQADTMHANEALLLILVVYISFLITMSMKYHLVNMLLQRIFLVNCIAIFYISTATSYVYLGDTFFRNYYVYHDVTNKRVGMYGTYMKYYESAPSNYTWIIVGACIAFVAIVIGICVFCCVCRAKSSGGASSTGKYSSAPPRRGAAPPPETVIF